MTSQFPDKDPGRYFADDEEVLNANGATYVMSNQWGANTEEAAKT
jgi:hypothetical protein